VAHDPLFDDFEALFGKAGDGGHDEILGDFLFLDEDGGRGPVIRGQAQGHDDGDKDDGQGRKDQGLFAPFENGQDVFGFDGCFVQRETSRVWFGFSMTVCLAWLDRMIQGFVSGGVCLGAPGCTRHRGRVQLGVPCGEF